MSSATPSGTYRSTRNEARLTSDKTRPLSIGAISRLPGADSPVVPAGPGDHPLVYQLLRSVFHGPTDSEFHAQLDHPGYEPTHRLLVRHRGAPVAHIRISPREMKFGGIDLSLDYIADLATLPEFRSRGLATALLVTAEAAAAQHSADCLLLRTSVPGFYARRGWTICGRHCYSSAPPRNILSVLGSLAAKRSSPKIMPIAERRKPTLGIRLWRHIEQEGLMRLYAQATEGMHGPLRRSEAYWHWLLCRRGYNQIYVAVESSPQADGEGDAESETIVGYAVMHRGRIVELIAYQQREDVKAELLARACGDAIERDEHVVRFDGPPGDGLHEVFKQAGGVHRWREAEGEQVFMMKLVEPLRLLHRLTDVLHQRAREAEISRPFELGFDVQDRRACLVGRRRSVRLEGGRLARSYLTCSPQGATLLLLGHRDAASLLASGRCSASTKAAASLAETLFPCVPLWYPPLDDLPA